MRKHSHINQPVAVFVLVRENKVGVNLHVLFETSQILSLHVNIADVFPIKKFRMLI